MNKEEQLLICLPKRVIADKMLDLLVGVQKIGPL